MRQPKGRREEPLVIQGGSSPKTRATCPLGEFGGWNGWKPHGLLLLNMISFPTSPVEQRQACRRHLGDHSTIPLYTYSESNTTTMRSPGRRSCSARKTPRNSPRLMLWRSCAGTQAWQLRSDPSPNHTPYPACIHPLTRFADPSVYTTSHPCACKFPSSCSSLALYAPHFASFF